MVVVPREFLVQRHDACVSAPGVILWSSTTDLATCEVAITNIVELGEVELAQMAPPEWFWDVILVSGDYGFGEYPFGEYPFGFGDEGREAGVYQDRDDIDNDWFIPPIPIVWGEGNADDGVYP
jgi:hypothetical protein